VRRFIIQIQFGCQEETFWGINENDSMF